MTVQYRSGITDEHLKALTEWLYDEYREAPIETNSTASLVSLEQESTLARRMCALAAGRYEEQRPLYFLPVSSKARTARALWLDGFDAVTITAPLIREIQALAGSAAKLICASAMRTETASLSSFSRAGLERLQHPFASDALHGMLTQGMLAFLVGHEIGHLAAGHLGVIQTYRHPSKKSTTASATGAMSDTAGEPDIGDPKVAAHLNAIEIDADVQACDFLLRHWEWVGSNAKKSLDDADPNKRLAAEIFTSLLDGKQARVFISLVCMTSMIALLGLGAFTPDRLLRKTHPLSAMRVIISMRTLISLYEVEQTSQLQLYRSEGAEAISFVHCVLGTILLQASELDESNQVAQQLAAIQSADRLDFLLAHTGIGGAINAMEEIGLHVKTLNQTFEQTLRIRIPHRRFAHKEIVRWV